MTEDIGHNVEEIIKGIGKEPETIQYTKVRCWNCNKGLGYFSTMGTSLLWHIEKVVGQIECEKCAEELNETN